MTAHIAAGTIPGHHTHFRRFSRADRILHALLMFSFLGLALTGLPLLFAHEGWAGTLARFFGGFQSAGLIHRACALLMIGVFTTHVGRIWHRLFVRKDLSILWGPSSMVPQPRDFFEMVAHLKWFVGLGPQPRFDHFTYWEKFDYWAVFWGMGIIGGSGLMLWFPETFARVVPGWVFNVAMVVHGEEALLAVVFIFTVHFFNGHLRPEKFPMDSVIFTGRVTVKEMEEERPDELARLAASGQVADLSCEAAPPWVYRFGRTIGTVAVVLGLLMVALIVYAFLN